MRAVLGGARPAARSWVSASRLHCTGPETLSRTSSSGTINKAPTGLEDPVLYDYVLAHTREPELLRELREETAVALPAGARMQVSPEQGTFLAMLVRMMGARRAIEVGVFTGYSALSIAQALPDDGLLVALDRDPAPVAIAQKYLVRAGASHKVDLRVGLAMEGLQALLEAGGADSFDFSFLDADKRNYSGYYELLLQLTRPGGVIVVDNVLWYGKVADEDVTDKTTQALRAFNDAVFADDRVEITTVAVGDGVTLCRKL